MSDPELVPEAGGLEARFVEWVGAIAALVEEQNRLRQENAQLHAQLVALAEETAELRAQLGTVPGTLERAAKAEVKVAIDAKIKELETLWKRKRGG